MQNMQKRFIQNLKELAVSEERKIALEIAEAGFSSIDTEGVMNSSIFLDGENLTIGCLTGKKKVFDLSKYEKIKVVGIGKSAPKACLVLEKILGEKIDQGVVVGSKTEVFKKMEFFSASHPMPTYENFLAGKRIFETVSELSEKDLLITVVTGGGSAMLCYPETEWEEGKRLYEEFLSAGQTIKEMNTVRKHLSLLKGGGIVKCANGATVIGLIFSDVPGDDFENVASGPTYMDKTFVKDAEEILEASGLSKYNLLETPKDEKIFEKVENFVLVSNKTAVEAMAKKSKELGLRSYIVSTNMYDDIEVSLQKIFQSSQNNEVVLAAGEPRIIVKKEKNRDGKGGRNLHMGLEAIKKGLIKNESIFISLASDGIDNTDAAGAVVDTNTIEKAKTLGLNVEDYLDCFDSYSFFQKTGDLIMTGPTGANVSDIMILFNKNNL